MRALLVKIRRIIARTIDGRKVMFLPYFLRDAYRTGHTISEIDGEKLYAEYIGEIGNELAFIVYPQEQANLLWLYGRIKAFLGSYGSVSIVEVKYTAL